MSHLGSDKALFLISAMLTAATRSPAQWPAFLPATVKKETQELIQ